MTEKPVSISLPPKPDGHVVRVDPHGWIAKTETTLAKDEAGKWTVSGPCPDCGITTSYDVLATRRTIGAMTRRRCEECRGTVGPITDWIQPEDATGGAFW